MNVLLALFLTFISSTNYVVEKDTLVNGLVIVACKKPGMPVFHVEVGLYAGSIFDKIGGEAYLTAQMLTDGIKDMDKKQISVIIDELGGNYSINTYKLYTDISLTVTTDSKEKALKLLSGLLTNPTFPEEEFNKEKIRLIQNIRRNRSEPRRYIQILFFREFYGDNPLGRPSTGTEETVSKLTVEDIRKFYKKYYNPQNAYLVVVSNEDPVVTISLVKKYFSDWEKGEAASFPAIELNTPDSSYIKTFHMETNQSYIMLGHVGTLRNNPDWPVIQLFNYALGGGGFSSRLLKEIRNKKGYTYSAYSYFTWQKEYPGVFLVSTFTKLDNTQAVVKEIKTILENFKTSGISEEELEEAKKYFEGALPRRVETYSGLAGRILEGMIYGLPDFYWEKEARVMQKITQKEVNRIIPEYLYPEKLMGVVITDTTKVKLKVD